MRAKNILYSLAAGFVAISISIAPAYAKDNFFKRSANAVKEFFSDDKKKDDSTPDKEKKEEKANPEKSSTTTTQSESTSAVQTGAVDVSNPAASKEAYEEIRSYNSNGELTGDTISLFSTDYLGYGYIGINANVIKVGEDQIDASLGQGETIAGIFRMEAHPAIHMQRIQRVDFGLAVLGEEGSAANDEADVIKDINTQ